MLEGCVVWDVENGGGKVGGRFVMGGMGDDGANEVMILRIRLYYGYEARAENSIHSICYVVQYPPYK
jgi:hypothetical protein